MVSGIPLFPQQGSTLAADVDALYFFIVAVTAFVALLVTIVVIYFAAKYSTNDPLEVGAAPAAAPPPSPDGPALEGRMRVVGLILFALIMSLDGFVFGVISIQLVALLEAAGLAQR